MTEATTQGTKATIDATYPETLCKAEATLIRARRKCPNAATEAQKEPSAEEAQLLVQGAVGLALSGGGIRSATLSLGYLQALAEAGALKHVDYLSTVSGGGYAGAFLGGLFQPRPACEAPVADRREAVTETLKDTRSFAVRWLRENGRYLAPNGSSDVWVAFATVVRNFFAVSGAFAVLTVTVLLLARGLRTVVEKQIPGNMLTTELIWQNVWWSPWFFLAGFVLLTFCVPVATAFWLIAPDNDDGAQPGIWASRAVPILLFAASCGVLSQATWSQAPTSLEWIHYAAIATATVTLLSFVAFVVATRSKTSSMNARNLVTVWLKSGLILFVAVLAFAGIDTLGQTLYAWAASGFKTWPLIGSATGTLTLGALAAFAQKVMGLFSTLRQRASFPIAATALIAALMAVTMVLVTFSAVAHAIAWQGEAPLDVTCLEEPVPGCDGETCSQTKACRLTLLHLERQPSFGGGDFSWKPSAWDWSTWGAILGVALTFCLGQARPFLNRSTLASFYAQRLTRTFLGASNASRERAVNQNVTRVMRGDAIAQADYAPHAHGGPLHLINVTLNETVTGHSQIEQRDRHGMNMAVGPVGISVGVKHHARWTAGDKCAQAAQDDTSHKQDKAGSLTAIPNGDDANFKVFPEWDSNGERPVFKAEPLDLGHWVSISGAAVSTGLGWRTSLGLSLLTAMLNLRLGRWWYSGVLPDGRAKGSDRVSNLYKLGRAFSRGLPVYAHLLDELLARFHGPASRHWYLTDGGHFDNTGAYELIRRRVEVIILCDNGGDGTTALGDFANFVRLARVDFATEIEFLDRNELATISQHSSAFERMSSGAIGTLGSLGFAPPLDESPNDTDPATSSAFASLAWINYPGNTPRGLLVLLRPRVTSASSVDVREYQRTNKDFPNDSTVDQFFDERQWESYRKLGFEIGKSLFPAPKTPGEGFWPRVVVRADRG